MNTTVNAKGQLYLASMSPDKWYRAHCSISQKALLENVGLDVSKFFALRGMKDDVIVFLNLDGCIFKSIENLMTLRAYMEGKQ